MPHWGEQVDTLERWRAFPALERADGADGIVLTFDDGPDQELARELVRRGHDVQLHGYGHVGHEFLADEDARRDLERGAETFRAGTGQEPRFYRPPYGRFSQASYETCKALGLQPVYWSAWGTDWETISPERIAELVIPDLSAGALVLLHDSSRYTHRPDARSTVEALPLITAAAAERGLAFVTLADAIDGR
jgi:peptidoglycan/xylan/chitin deacetylase (PgdA/CDA1 family)